MLNMTALACQDQTVSLTVITLDATEGAVFQADFITFLSRWHWTGLAHIKSKSHAAETTRAPAPKFSGCRAEGSSHGHC